MKRRTTKRDVIASYKYVLSVSNGGLQQLLKYEVPEAYTEGIYGWNADIYTHPDFPNVCICMGDRPFGNMELPSEVLRLIEATMKLSDSIGEGEVCHKQCVRDLFRILNEGI